MMVKKFFELDHRSLGRCGVLLGFLAAATAAVAGPPIPYQVYDSPKRLDSTVFEAAHYHHAPTVAEFNGRIHVAWNGNLYNSTEGQPGQVIMLRSSDDGGRRWSDTKVPFVKEYRALDELGKKGVDALGNADDDHKIRLASARQWQPSLVAFRGKLLMFWGQDRGAPGSALMMSALEPDGEQWRSHEMRFGAKGVPYMMPVRNAGKGSEAVSDPPYISIETGARAIALDGIVGARSIPSALNVADLPAQVLKEAGAGGDGRSAAAMPMSLVGQRLVPSPNQATVVKDSRGQEVLVVALVLQQSIGDWNNLVLKLPATLTTTDLVNWKLSVVPLRSEKQDFLGEGRGDLGMISAWEPTVTENIDGGMEMLFRINLPPTRAGGGDPGGTAFRLAHAQGQFTSSGAIEWGQARPLDMDVPVTRGMATRILRSNRWVMVHNHFPQGAVYANAAAPAFRSDKYEPWARRNLTVFFSTRGKSDYVAGYSMSAATETVGVEMAHYPAVVSRRSAEGIDELMVVYSTHRRVPACQQQKSAAPVALCHDSIQFSRIRMPPDPAGAYIYPNHLANHYAFGRAKPQEKSFGYTAGKLTLFDRGSAGIDTQGDSGCLNLRFRTGKVGAADRPVLSFGRSADRVTPIGLSIKAKGPDLRLSLGATELAGNYRQDDWISSRVCFDHKKKTMSVGDVTVRGGDAMSDRAYLGDSTLGRVEARLPDLEFDVAAMSLDSPATSNDGSAQKSSVPAKPAK
jgi:hypothetical protein